jgi:hypothetical protein
MNINLKPFDGWSFCIISTIGNESILSDALDKIKLEFRGKVDFEIIVVGSINKARINLDGVTFLEFKEDIFSIKKDNFRRFLSSLNFKDLFFRRGAICRKKNLAVEYARYENICLMHDYVGLEKGWLDGFNKFGYSWDVCMNIILNKDNSRHRDWMAWDHPSLTSHSDGSGACLIPYDKYTYYMYISGTYFCVKKSFFIKNPLNPKYFWGEGEDVEWSMRVRAKTRFVMNQYSTVKFLKLKSLDEPPYINNWQQNANDILKFLDGH